MIEIKKLTTKNEYAIFFNGENFIEILNYCKEHYFKWKSENKYWTADRRGTKNFYNSFKNLEDIKIEEDVKFSLAPTIGQKFIPNKFDKSLLKYKPKGEYQVEGIKKLITRSRFALFDGMGVGKTYQVVSAFNHFEKERQIDKILILCPPEVKFGWKVEFSKFFLFYDKEDFSIFNTKNNRNPFLEKKRIVIMSYDNLSVLYNDIYKEKYGKKVGKKLLNLNEYKELFENWIGDKKACIVFDESHSLKSLKTRRYKLVKQFVDYFDYRYLLTGTPHPNGVHELYTQFDILDESIIDEDYIDWLSSIANMGNRFSKLAINYYYTNKVEKFLKSVQGYYLKRATHDVLGDELKGVTDKTYYAELSGKQAFIYKMLTIEMVNELNKNEELEEDEKQRKMINYFPYFSLALDNPSVLKTDRFENEKLNEAIRSFKIDDHGKIEILDALLDRLIKDEKKKVTIFDIHPITIEALAKRYKKYNPITIHGQDKFDKKNFDSKEEYRHFRISEFADNEENKLLIASPLVVKTGINQLVCCHEVIWFSKSWSLEANEQPLGRFDRIGQKHEVENINILFEGSLNILQEKAINKKIKLSATLLNKKLLKQGDWKKIFNMTADSDIENLF